MKKIFVCSPCRGDYEANIERAIGYSRAIVLLGDIPITPHIYLTRFLDDRDSDERKIGLNLGRTFLTLCDELWTFGPNVSEGMAAELELASKLGIPAFDGFVEGTRRIHAELKQPKQHECELLLQSGV